MSSASTACFHLVTVTKPLENDVTADFRSVASSEASRRGDAHAFRNLASSFFGVPLGPEGNQQLIPSTAGETGLQTLILNNPTDSGMFPTRTPPIPPATPSASPQLDACWASTPCMNFINDFTTSYDVIVGNLIDRINRNLSGLAEASLTYSNHFCKVRNYEKSGNFGSYVRSRLTMLQSHFERHCRASDANAILSPMLQASRRKD
jgi:hypothetical protein